MITIVDYGMGNLRSVAKAFEKLGFKAEVTQKPEEIRKASKLVLPGVGAFGDAVHHLERLRLAEEVRRFLKEEKPFLGICLGLQLLFTESEEGGLHKGFGILPGRVRVFPNKSLKVPHIGWNQIRRFDLQKGQECPLLRGIPDGSYFYFVHSYYADPLDQAIVTTRTDYGLSFVSMIWKGSCYAMQFHPEKSQNLGLKILENFGRL